MSQATERKVNAHLTIVLLGDGGVGKTAWCERLCKGDFVKKYDPTRAMQTHSVTLCHSSAKHHLIEYTLRDTCGQEKFGATREACYQGADAAILMFDVTSRVTYKNVSTWYKDFRRVCPQAIVLLVGNKNDCKDRVVQPRHITFHRKHNLQYYDVSTKTNHNLEKPLLSIARQHFKEPDVVLLKCSCRAEYTHHMWLQRQPDAAPSSPSTLPDPVPDAAPADDDDDL